VLPTIFDLLTERTVPKGRLDFVDFCTAINTFCNGARTERQASTHVVVATAAVAAAAAASVVIIVVAVSAVSPSGQRMPSARRLMARTRAGSSFASASLHAVHP
jgi:hypothetical protein